MSNFTHTGNVVSHLQSPRFQIAFVKQPDGSWTSTDFEFHDAPIPNAQTLARLMREAGDYFAAQHHTDWLQQRVIARARELGLTAYAIAKATCNAVSEDHVKNYLERRSSMGSHKLQHVLRVLRLDVTPEVCE